VFGSAVEDYLKAVYKLSQTGDRVAPSAVAEVQGVSLAAVTKMVRRLQELKLVTYARADGIALTPAGAKVALEIIRHHRLLEVYLKDALGYTWDQVDGEAEVLEHVISEEFEDRIDAMLGHPTRDPHGDPIPTKDGRIDSTLHPALVEMEPGQKGRVARVSDADPEMLRYLGKLGIYPEVAVELVEREPFGGPFHVKIAGRKHRIGEELARNVFISLGRST
jgi:DtxR family Mn-dependent transcriptional regulator